MLAAERWGRGACGLERLNVPRTLVIGAAQAVALLPGVSRSGVTISTGMFAGMSRAAAARFSFLLSAPVVVAAGLRELPDIRHAADQGLGNTALAAGFLVSFAVGLAAIHFLLRYLATRPLNIFAWYRLAFAAFILAALSVR
jgi:undecaprenyl-diphosphatase